MKPGGQNSGGAWWFAVIAFGLLVAWLGWRSEPASLPVLQVSSASTFSPPIRVNLTPTPARQISLEIDGDYIVRPVGSSLVLGHGGRTGPITVTPTATGLRIGEQTYSVTRLEIVPAKSPAIWVGEHQYRGSVRFYRQPGGRFLAINVLPLEEYIASVIDSEMPAAFPEAARQAQAIVARTYALAQMQAAGPAALFDVYATARSQKYLGFQYRDATGRRLAGESAASRAVAADTRGIVCTHRGRLFCTYYSAVCGGRTTLGTELFADAAPPLQSVPCDWCREAKLFRWTSELSRATASEQIAKHFASKRLPFASVASLEQLIGDDTGRLSVFRVSDGRHTHELTGAELRDIWPAGVLHSPRFRITEQSERFTMSGRGHGHGVGLCQWGARGQALAGRNCLDILRHYYPGCEIVVLRP